MTDNLNYSIIISSDSGIAASVKNGKIKNDDKIIIKRLGSSPNFEVFLEDKLNSGFGNIKLDNMDNKFTKILNQDLNVKEVKGFIYNITQRTEPNGTETTIFKIAYILN